MKSSLEIAQDHRMQPIVDIAAAAGLDEDEIELYGRYKAKIELSAIERLSDRPDAKIVNVTAITPTPAGEGKTTTRSRSRRASGTSAKPILCLREPSLGPVFGVKGGAAGGGFAQVVPMEDLNLHFTGDMHAITAAQQPAGGVRSTRTLSRQRARHRPVDDPLAPRLDMNDRNLRNIVIGARRQDERHPARDRLRHHGRLRGDGDPGLARDLGDSRRLGRITVGQTLRRRAGDGRGDPVRGRDGGAAARRDQAEPDPDARGPAVPDARRAVREHRARQQLARGRPRSASSSASTSSPSPASRPTWAWRSSWTSSAAPGACAPHAVVIVATVRALCMHGGGGLEKPATAAETMRLIEVGCENLAKHIENVREFGIEPVVAVNQRPEDTAEELALVKRLAGEAGALSAVHNGFGAGGPGAAELAEAVVEACDRPTDFQLLYRRRRAVQEEDRGDRDAHLRCRRRRLRPAAIQRLKDFQAQGLGHFTVCMAKTHLSLSADPNLKGRPRGFRIPVRDVRAYTGAGFIVPLCGDMLQMPGLGKQAAGFDIDIDKDGKIVGNVLAGAAARAAVRSREPSACSLLRILEAAPGCGDDSAYRVPAARRDSAPQYRIPHPQPALSAARSPDRRRALR